MFGNENENENLTWEFFENINSFFKKCRRSHTKSHKLIQANFEWARIEITLHRCWLCTSDDFNDICLRRAGFLKLELIFSSWLTALIALIYAGVVQLKKSKWTRSSSVALLSSNPTLKWSREGNVNLYSDSSRPSSHRIRPNKTKLCGCSRFTFYQKLGKKTDISSNFCAFKAPSQKRILRWMHTSDVKNKIITEITLTSNYIFCEKI